MRRSQSLYSVPSSLTESPFHKGEYSHSSHWTRENRISDSEITDSLCEEIKMLLHDSKVLDEQYKAIIRHYQNLAKNART